jgi:hypothetical protein
MAAEKADLVGLAPDAASLQVRLQAQRQLVDHEQAQENESEQELQEEGFSQGLYGGGGNNNGMNGGGDVGGDTFDGEGRLRWVNYGDGADYEASVRFREEQEWLSRNKHPSDCELELPLGRGVTVEDVAAMAEETPKFRNPRPPHQHPRQQSKRQTQANDGGD